MNTSRIRFYLTLTAALSPLVTAACVSQGRYDAKVAELEAARTALEQERQASNKRQQDASALAARLEEAKQALLEAEQAAEHLMVDRMATVDAYQRQLTAQRELLAEFDALASAYGAETPEELEAALARLQNRVRETEQALALAARELEREKRISSKLQALIDAGTLRVRRRSGRLVIELPGDIHFASGSAKLTDIGKSTLAELAKVLQAESDRLFVVEGHTDNVPIQVSGFRSNWHLGATRAEMSRDVLVASGLDAARCSIASWAELLPACPEVDDKDCRQRNRRVEVVLLPRFE
jgi:chemotaxis protein MotB